MTKTRIAVVADVHHGRDTPTKKGSAALPLLSRFVDRADEHDAVIDLGDRISDVNPEQDRVLQMAVVEQFKRLRVPRHHVSGNHDRALLSLEENERLLDAPSRDRVAEIGNVRIAFWQPDVSLSPQRGFHLADGDLAALSALLDDDRPTLLVSHVPLARTSQSGNYYFENNPGHATYAESDAIRSVLAAAPCPVVAIAGHVHWNTLTVVDGTPHITLQSLTEAFISGAASECSAVLEIDGDILRWSVLGLEPFAVTLPWKRSKSKWMAPLASFSERSRGAVF
ncbi:calcineurin-like phosphoesterase superfamily domain protein [Variibacter gotjawalensis]|uniref:Calcineurin-like phosphoesterase superfamily domain protein n=1 Tax=Variibacter gotjawalensis TaxID=1333996 RepID=A0A0S3PT88_9BRAD|nr:metallophosphoesterase [Variibacter gotjawalensis]NIK49421.1 hypothetical protein [Variibacter gotjawalensis]RZS51273.1 calcineurin-like phosphoesterase family protein [Variibacter gotjawalensis]BAT59106.1 calcineurin-like phosphoesterase superfamily domain protein [Variibacter gotjawalensis]